MKGKIAVKVLNNRVQYKFTLNRNITILRGDSATGKTTLIDMVRAYEMDHDAGVTLVCEKACHVLGGSAWRDQLKRMKDSVVFVDEGNQFLRTPEFASAIKKTDNYYVIATRNPLPTLPYSVQEVYGITNVTKGYGRVKRVYSQFRNLYPASPRFEDFDLVIVEDSNAGYEFFKRVFEGVGCACVSAKGKSKMAKRILVTPVDSRILVIADGAAFGPEMESVMKAGYLRRVEIYLPESFEWLILKSGVVDGNRVQAVLQEPSDFIESKTYFSWERFFTALMVEATQDTYLAYSKKTLNPAYLQERQRQAILRNVPLPMLGA